jgi:Zn-dependent protease with chaperone function
MAIASGVATPEIYVLNLEPGINAFAAGFSPDDAAITVTRGTLEHLNREELQGVIAHEFSHVLNGDMKLNIRLMGPLFGILAIGLLGRLVLRNLRFSRRSKGGKSGGGAAVIVALGIGLTVTGYVGLLAGRLIKAGVSRQREYLADASAVQFTRDTHGIAGALKKIGGLTERSSLNDSEAEEVSHMLFADGMSSFSSMLATHPPLLDRIQVLEPNFSRDEYLQLHTETLVGAEHFSEPAAAGFTASAEAPITADPDSLLQSVGNPDERHIGAARDFRAGIPAVVRAAFESADRVMLLLPALILHPDPGQRRQQLDMLSRQLGNDRSKEIEALFGAIESMPGNNRLPLLDLALPHIKTQPTSRQDYLLELLDQLANQDNHIELFEYALLRTVRAYLDRAADPGAKRRWRRLSDPIMHRAAATLLNIYSHHGHRSEANAAAACKAGMAVLGGPEADTTRPIEWIPLTDEALIRLRDCVPKDRRTLIRALLATALHDGTISRSESELLRAVCALLECPMPPLMAADG